jgi:hypothetical protein
MKKTTALSLALLFICLVFDSSSFAAEKATITLKENIQGGYIRFNRDMGMAEVDPKREMSWWDEPINSADLLVFLTNASDVGGAEPLSVFSNILPKYSAAANLYTETGILGSNIDKFPNNHNISRAEFLKLMSFVMNISPSQTKSSFADVSGHWAEGYISEFERLGHISGYPDGLFLPDKYLTNAEFVTIIGNAVQIENTARLDRLDNHWAYNYISTALYFHEVTLGAGIEYDQIWDDDNRSVVVSPRCTAPFVNEEIMSPRQYEALRNIQGFLNNEYSISTNTTYEELAKLWGMTTYRSPYKDILDTLITDRSGFTSFTGVDIAFGAATLDYCQRTREYTIEYLLTEPQ